MFSWIKGSYAAEGKLAIASGAQVDAGMETVTALRTAVVETHGSGRDGDWTGTRGDGQDERRSKDVASAAEGRATPSAENSGRFGGDSMRTGGDGRMRWGERGRYWQPLYFVGSNLKSESPQVYLTEGATLIHTAIWNASRNDLR